MANLMREKRKEEVENLVPLCYWSRNGRSMPAFLLSENRQGLRPKKRLCLLYALECCLEWRVPGITGYG